MRRRAWLLVIAAVTGFGCLYVALWGSLGDLFPMGDYPGPPCNGCDTAGPPLASLVRGHFSAFFSTQPFQGSTSLLLRAPGVAVVTWLHGDVAVQYRIGSLICFLAAALLLVPAVRAMLHRGQHPMVVVALMLAIFVGPATFKALRWGHPEEILGAALAVAAVVAAIQRRSVWAGVLLGLAVATKQWGLFAILPVLIVSPGHRRQIAFLALGVAAVFMIPMFVGDPARFLDQNFHTAVAQIGVEPTNIWWPFHRPGFDPSIHQPLNVIPSALDKLSHPLALLVILGLSLLYWRRRGDAQPYDVLQLLALLFLLRCLLDPLTISYHHVPFVLSLAVCEGLRRRGLPVLTLMSTAVILGIASVPYVLDHPDLMNAVYLAWALPTAIYLTAGTFGGHRFTPSLRMLDQEVMPEPALTG